MSSLDRLMGASVLTVLTLWGCTEGVVDNQHPFENKTGAAIGHPGTPGSTGATSNTAAISNPSTMPTGSVFAPSMDTGSSAETATGSADTGPVAGMGGTATGTDATGTDATGTDATGTGMDATGTESMARTPTCIDDPNQIILMGDSYVEYTSHDLPGDLVARSGQTWPNYAVPGTAMATGGLLGFIPPQFDMAIQANPDLKVVVMDGGGNDILIPDAFMWPGSDQCTASASANTMEVCTDIVQAAVDKSQEVMMKMANSGIEDVIFFFYPHIPGNTTNLANTDVMLDYAMPLAREACELAAERTGGKLHCLFVDTVPLFEGKTGVFDPDGIHPNFEGSKIIADAIWSTMTDNCVGQPSSAGCCMPPQ